MRRCKSGMLLIFFAAAVLAAAELPDWAAKLPPELARVDEHAISRAEGVALLQKQLGNRTLPGSEYLPRLRRALLEELCRRTITAELTSHGFAPSAQRVLDLIDRTESYLPQGWKKLTVAERNRLADDPDTRLRVATQLYLLKSTPEKLRIRDSEIEDYYRENQHEFRIPGGYEPLERAAFYIRQQLEAKKAAAELEKLLRRRLASTKIEVFF